MSTKAVKNGPGKVAAKVALPLYLASSRITGARSAVLDQGTKGYSINTVFTAWHLEVDPDGRRLRDRRWAAYVEPRGEHYVSVPDFSKLNFACTFSLDSNRVSRTPSASIDARCQADVEVSVVVEEGKAN